MSNDYYVVSGDSLREVADTIREKNNMSEQLVFPDGWIDTINNIKTDGTENIWQDSNGFVHLPVKEEEVPDDGKTRIWIYIPENTPDNRLTFYLRFISSVANNTTVDWGDGTIQTLGSTTATNYSHKYSQGGNYIITMTVNNGTISFEGDDNNNRIYGELNRADSHLRTRIIRVIFGNNITGINYKTFSYCYSLKSVVLPNNITNIGEHAFEYCYSLTSIIIPNTVTSIGNQAFAGCYSLASVIMPDSVTNIDTGAFYYDDSLTSIIIPVNVTNIGLMAFTSCRSMSEYHFKSTTPPVLASDKTFQEMPSDCIIYVPYSANHSILNAYKTATNWSTVASQIQEEPQS